MNSDHLLLGGLLRRTVKTFSIVQLVSLMLYIGYRVYIPSTTNTNKDNSIFALSFSLSLICIFSSLLCSKVASLSSPLVDLCIFLLTIITGVEIYNLSVIVDSRHAITTIILSISFILFDLIFMVLFVYIRFAFSWEAWRIYISQVNKGKYDVWDFHVQEKEKEPLTKFFIKLTLAIETTSLYFYILLIFSVGLADKSGYIYFAHTSTIATASTWLAFDDLKAGDTRTYHWLLAAASLMFMFDVAQIIETSGTGSGDPAIFVAIRGILLFCAIIYISVVVYAGTEIEVMAHHRIMFYAIQYVMTTVIAFELMFVFVYFVYQNASVNAASNTQWMVLFHIITAVTATVVCCITDATGSDNPYTIESFMHVENMRKALYILLAVSFILTAYDLYMVEAWIIPVIELPLFLISLTYITICAVVLTGIGGAAKKTFDDAAVLYFKIVEEERLTNNKALEYAFTKDAPKTTADIKKMSQERYIDYLIICAEKIYFIIGFIIKKVVTVEIVAFYILIVIMTEDVIASNDPPWFQWFYMVHAFTIGAVLMAITFHFDVVFVLRLMVVAAVICLVTDVFLLAFLMHRIKSSLLTIQVIFIVVDFAYIFFYFLLYFRNNPGAFTMLKFMDKLSERIKLNSKL